MSLPPDSEADLSAPRIADTFDLRASLTHIGEACRMHAWVIALTPLFTLLLVGLYTWKWPAVYSADAVLLAEADTDTSRDQFYYFWNMFRKEDVKSEVGLMTSTAVIADVVHKLHLHYEDVYHPFFNHATYLWTDSIPGKAYHSLKKWIWSRGNPYEPTDEEADFARTVLDFKAGISVAPLPDSHVGILRVKGPSPRVAELANTLVATMLEHRRERYVTEATVAYDSLKKEVDSVRAELATAENARKRFYADNQLLMEFEKEKVDINSYASLETVVADFDAQLVGLRRKQELLERLLGDEPAEVLMGRVQQANPARQEIMHNRVSLEAALAEALVRYRPKAPEIANLRARIAAMDGLLGTQPDEVALSTTRTSESKAQLAAKLKETTIAIASIEGTLEAKKTLLTSLRDRLARIPVQMVDLHRMERGESAVEKKFTILQERLMMAEVSIMAARSAPASIKVVDYAEAPSKPEWPNSKLLYMGALVLGLFSGASLAVLIDTLSPRVTEARLRLRAAHFPMFATIDCSNPSAALSLRLPRKQPTQLVP